MCFFFSCSKFRIKDKERGHYEGSKCNNAQPAIAAAHIDFAIQRKREFRLVDNIRQLKTGQVKCAVV